MVRPRRCYLCDMKTGKNISFHRFPKDPVVCKIWKDACGLLENDDTKNVFLCSDHFTETRVAIVNGHQERRHINRGAIPTIAVINPPQMPLVNTLQNNYPIFVDNTSVYSIESSTDTETSFPSDNCKPLITDVKTLDFEEICIEVTGSDVLESPVQVDQENIEFNTDEFLPDNHEDSNIGEVTCNSSINENEGNSTPARKRRCFEPRYPGEIEYEDFIDCPKRAMRVINMILESDRKKTKELNKLSKQDYYFKKKLKLYQRVIDDLKKT